MNSKKILSSLTVILLFLICDISNAQTTVTIGNGTSSSSTRGPFQRSDTNSTSVYSRNVLLFTAAELSAAGIISGSSISELAWEKGNSNVIIGTGNANLKLYLRNSTATSIDTTDWAMYIPGSTLVLDTNFNTTNNFPSTSGWMAFPLNNSFTYTGGALEIAIDWDASQLTTPQFSGNGAVTWRWSATTGNTLAQRVSGSAAPNDLTKVKSERANTQIVYGAATPTCPAPTALNAVATSTTNANFNWVASMGAVSYNWKIVAAGAGPTATAIDFGNTTGTSGSTSMLSMLTSYDLYVEADCGATVTSGFVGPYSFFTPPLTQTTVTIGAGTSSSSTRGPLQRSDTNSSTVFSRWHQIYTASELTTAGVTSGSMITSLNWELASTNMIVGSGDANVKVYLKNSTATSATTDTWVNLISGSTLVVDNDYNTTNNFPGVNGWMPFNFSTPFNYTGGAIEISVDWDCSQVSTPAFSGDGALKWRWESTAPTDLVVKKTGSSSAPSNLSDLRNERANIQFVFAGSTVGIDQIKDITNLTISPNPTNGIANIDLDLLKNAAVDVAIYTIKGELIENFSKENVSELRHTVNLSRFENGLYFVRLSINGETTTKKIIFLK